MTPLDDAIFLRLMTTIIIEVLIVGAPIADLLEVGFFEGFEHLPERFVGQLVAYVAWWCDLDCLMAGHCVAC